MLGHPDTYYRPFPHRKESGLCLPPRYQPGMCPSSTCRLQGGRQCASMVGFCFLFFFSPQRCLTCLGTEKPRWLEAKSDYKAVTSCVSEPGVSSNGVMLQPETPQLSPAASLSWENLYYLPYHSCPGLFYFSCKAGCFWGEGLVPLLDPLPRRALSLPLIGYLQPPLEGGVMAFHAHPACPRAVSPGLLWELGRVACLESRGVPFSLAVIRVLATTWHVWRLRQGSLGRV